MKRRKISKEDYVERAAKAKRTRAAKVLQGWIEDNSSVDLISCKSNLTIQGSLSALGIGGGQDFFFKSVSGDVTSQIFLLLYDKVSINVDGPWGTAINLEDTRGQRDLTLRKSPVTPATDEETAALVKQLRLWIKLKSKVYTLSGSPFGAAVTICEIKELSDSVFLLIDDISGRTDILLLSQCHRITVKKASGHTKVDLYSLGGRDWMRLSDQQESPEEMLERFAIKTPILQ